MDVILSDSQAIILIPALQGVTFAGDGYEKDLEPLRDEGYMERVGNTRWHQISDKGKEFVKLYLESVYQIVTIKLKCNRYNVAIFDISLETGLSVGVLENMVLEYFAEQGLLGKIIDKNGNQEVLTIIISH